MATYNPAWTNADSNGRVDSTCYHGRGDLDEIAAAINRRRLLVIQEPWDYDALLDVRPYVSQYVIDDSTESPAADNALNFRQAVIDRILLAAPGRDTYYVPSNPSSLAWLWPLADADENKTVVTWLGSPSPTQVGLFNRLNGSPGWTDPAIVANATHTSPARAVHINELRQALEWLRRGRWVLPMYWNVGLFTGMPNVPWFGSLLTYDGTSEARALGVVRPHIGPRGLHGVRAIAASVSITFSAACVVEMRQVLRSISFDDDWPTWNHYRGDSGLPWSQPGGCGAGDSEVVFGPAPVSAGVPLVIDGANGGSGWLPTWQSVLDQDSSPFFLLRRLDAAAGLVDILSASLTLTFELDSPPA